MTMAMSFRAVLVGACLAFTPVAVGTVLAQTPVTETDAISPILFIAQQAQSGDISVDTFMKAVLAEELRMLQHGLTAAEARAARHLVDAFGTALPDYRQGLVITLGNVAAADSRNPVLTQETRDKLGAAALEAARYPDPWTKSAAMRALTYVEASAVVPVLLAALQTAIVRFACRRCTP